MSCSNGIICLVTTTRTRKDSHNVPSSASLTPSHSRRTLVFSPAFITFTQLSFLVTLERSSQRPLIGPSKSDVDTCFYFIQQRALGNVLRKSLGAIRTIRQTAMRLLIAGLPQQQIFSYSTFYCTKLINTDLLRSVLQFRPLRRTYTVDSREVDSIL